MSADPTYGEHGPIGGSGAPSSEPSEEELRAAYEAELNRMTTTDMIAQATVSLLNLGARRLGPPPTTEAGAGPGAPTPGAAGGRDLEQVRDAIDASRALLGVLERTIPQELRPLRDALSQLQMAYAREVQSGAPPTAGAGATAASAGPGPAQSPPPGAGAQPSAEERPGGPGPAESSGRLWVPGR